MHLDSRSLSFECASCQLFGFEVKREKIYIWLRHNNNQIVSWVLQIINNYKMTKYNKY